MKVGKLAAFILLLLLQMPDNGKAGFQLHSADKTEKGTGTPSAHPVSDKGKNKNFKSSP